MHDVNLISPFPRSNINGIAGSKFEISVVTFVSVVTFSYLSLYTILPTSDTRFNWDGCQGDLGAGVSHGLLKTLKGTPLHFAENIRNATNMIYESNVNFQIFKSRVLFLDKLYFLFSKIKCLN